MSSKALYGPERWPVGRPGGVRSKLLTGAELVVASERPSLWAVEPWFQHHGVPVEQGLRVIKWLGHSKELGNCTVQHVVGTYHPASWNLDKVRGVYGHRSHNIVPLDPSDHGACDIIVKAITEAKKGMPVTDNALLDTWRWAPAGVVERTKWWRGNDRTSRYYGGRAPLASCPELPDDALRCICEQLVPTVPSKSTFRPSRGTVDVPQSNEEFVAEAQEYCDENTTDAALEACAEDDLSEVVDKCDTLQADMADRIRRWHRDRGNVAKRLPMVSRHWLHTLGKPMNLVVAEIPRMNEHNDMLEGVYGRVYDYCVARGAPYDY